MSSPVQFLPQCQIYFVHMLPVIVFRSVDSAERRDQELLRRRSASVLEVKERAHSRLREELLRAQKVGERRLLVNTAQKFRITFKLSIMINNHCIM